MIGCLFAGSAMSANWVHLATDHENNKYSIDTTRINKVQTMLSTTGQVRSAWIKMQFSKELHGASYILSEEYIKCNEQKTATNTIVSYGSNRMVVHSSYNVSGPSVDFAMFKPASPDSIMESLVKTICALNVS